MPTTQPTLQDIAKLTGTEGLAALVEEVVTFAPEVQIGAARTIKGTQYKTIIRTSLPTVGFRAANAGVATSKSGYENRLIECYIFNPTWQADKMVANACEDGAEAFIAAEAKGVLQSSMIFLGKQFYYGTGNDVLGFPGLLTAVDPSMVANAAGTGSACSSVWAVKFGADDVQWVWGGNGSFKPSDITEQRVLDANGKPYTAYCQEIASHVGLQVKSIYSVAQLKNVTAVAPLTDAMLIDLLALFPVGKKPDCFFMNRRSLVQLQKSRTATTTTGAPAPIPTESHGVPITVTDSITNTETAA